MKNTQQNTCNIPYLKVDLFMCLKFNKRMFITYSLNVISLLFV